MQPQAFYRVVADDFTAVDDIIRRQLTSRVPLVEKIGDYIVSAGGKRLRPLLVLLSGNALGFGGEQLRLLAATIEFLHTSTLLHDDVVDASAADAEAEAGMNSTPTQKRLAVTLLSCFSSQSPLHQERSSRRVNTSKRTDLPFSVCAGRMCPSIGARKGRLTTILSTG